jgi:hypothetical protein
MEQTYANKRRDSFDADLDAKQWVILVRRPDDECIVGFSTQTLFEVCVDGIRVTALYSGDTVVDRSHWGDPALAHAWGNFALELIDRHPVEQGSLYWFLTSKGFRTYHYLPLFFRHYFPRPGVETPGWERSIMETLAKRVAEGRYYAEHGIIRADGRSDFVRLEIAGAGGRRHHDAHVRFFTERNPGFAHGDELCCLAPLSRENFTAAAYRVMGLWRVPAPAM